MAAAPPPPPPPPPPNQDPLSKIYGHRASPSSARATNEYEKGTNRSAGEQIPIGKLPPLTRASPISHRPSAAAMAAPRGRKRDAAAVTRSQVADLFASGREFAPVGRTSPPCFEPVPAHPPGFPPPPVPLFPDGQYPLPSYFPQATVAATASTPRPRASSAGTGAATAAGAGQAGPSRPASSSATPAKAMNWEELCRNHVEPPPYLQDCLPLVMLPPGSKPLLPSLALTIKEQQHRRENHLPEVGRKPRIGKMERAKLPRRFCVQVDNIEFQAVIIPEAITPLLVEKFHLKPFKNSRAKNGETDPKVCIPLRTTKCCEYSVQLRWFDGRLVMYKGWEEFVKDMDLRSNDVVHFKYNGHGFKVKLFRFIDASQHIFFCAHHQSY